MTERMITITNRAGIHARPAGILVGVAKDFKSNIYIEKDNFRINGKSIMGVITLGAVYGMEVNIIAEGEDEKEAVEALVRLLESNFEEE
jgi:phosphocarrier protein